MALEGLEGGICHLGFGGFRGGSVNLLVCWSAVVGCWAGHWYFWF